MKEIVGRLHLKSLPKDDSKKCQSQAAFPEALLRKLSILWMKKNYVMAFQNTGNIQETYLACKHYPFHPSFKSFDNKMQSAFHIGLPLPPLILQRKRNIKKGTVHTLFTFKGDLLSFYVKIISQLPASIHKVQSICFHTNLS